MPTLLLVRHAQGSFGDADYDVLSKCGHEQATALADDLEARGVAIGAGLVTAVLLAGGERLPGWSFYVTTACGTVLITFGLVFNGERHGGAAGGDEMYYLWVVLYAAYYLGRWATAAQVAFIGAAYTVALVVIDPGATPPADPGTQCPRFDPPPTPPEP